MVICLKCNKQIDPSKEKQGISICMDCTTKIFNALPSDVIRAMAEVGIYALIDEATGYEKIRPKDDLRKLYDEKAKA